jgi:hypothetical protein
VAVQEQLQQVTRTALQVVLAVVVTANQEMLELVEQETQVHILQLKVTQERQELQAVLINLAVVVELVVLQLLQALTMVVMVE